MLRIEVSHQARKDLINIEIYTTERFGVEQKTKYLDEIRSAFLTIREHPRIGYKTSVAEGQIHCFHVKRHKLLYQIETPVVTILRVLHERQVPSLHLDGSME